jgi:hypothetical protein
MYPKTLYLSKWSIKKQKWKYSDVILTFHLHHHLHKVSVWKFNVAVFLTEFFIVLTNAGHVCTKCTDMKFN